MQIREECLTDIIDEFREIVKDHYHEIALYQDRVPLDPDYGRYIAMDEAGIVCCVTARDEGKLVGYAIFFVMPHIHYKSTVFAMNDILYLAPEYRGGSLGVDLLTISESILITLGANVVQLHMKVHKPWHKLAEACGYSMGEYTYSKVLEG